MKALTKAQIEERNDLQSRLVASREKIEELVADHNLLVDEATNWMTHLAERARDYYDSRSEKWQEGDAGGAYSTWLEQLESELEYADLSGVEADETIANIEDMP